MKKRHTEHRLPPKNVAARASLAAFLILGGTPAYIVIYLEVSVDGR